jgi:hypothetical protein
MPGTWDDIVWRIAFSPQITQISCKSAVEAGERINSDDQPQRLP